MDCKTRHRVVRCGRRWGKSSHGEIEVAMSGALGHRFIGLFTPQMMYLEVTWANLRSRLGPLIHRVNDSKHRMELVNGTVVEAWTLENNPEAGRSRKYHLAVVDEAGLIPGFRRWWDSCLEPTLIDYVGRALILGTPHTAGPDFDDLFDRAASGVDPQWAAFTAKTFDNDFLPAVEKARIMARRAEMPDWLWLQEYEAIPADGASGFFPRSLIKAHKAANVSEPVRRGEIVILGKTETDICMVLEKRDLSKIQWRDDPRGAWKLWTDLDGDRPPQGAAWAMGVDIGAGVGAANSVISVGDGDTGVKWAECASAGITPERWARIACAAGLWFGGRKHHTLMQFENNGGFGQQYAREVIRRRYPMICSQRLEPGDPTTKVTDWGWTSTAATKEAMLSEYRAALAHGKFANPSEMAMDECLGYRYDSAGRLVSVADQEVAIDESRAPHGDRVIADGLLYDAMRQTPAVKAAPVAYPRESIGYRMEEYKRQKQRGSKLTY